MVFYCIMALFGLLVGSFLNVVIYRLPVMMEREWRRSCEELNSSQEFIEDTSEKFNLATPASRCPSCDAAISPWQNIPVLSYIVLLGKCRNCKTHISLRYPLVEIATAILTVVVAVKFGLSLECLVAVPITWCLVALSMIDYDHQLLPDSLTLPLLWAGLLASLIPIFTNPADAILGATAGYLVLWTIYQLFKFATGKEGMGYGDFKLLAAFGAWLGWQSLPTIILVSSLAGSIIGILLIVLTKRNKNVPIPFGPFIAIAGWVVMVFGDSLYAIFPSVML